MGAQILVETLSLLVRRFLSGADAGVFRLVVKLQETSWNCISVAGNNVATCCFT